LQRLQNKVLRTGNFPRHTPVCELYNAFNIPYIYDYITKLCKKQGKIIQHHGNANIRNIGQGEQRHRKLKRLKLGGGQVSTVQVFRLMLQCRLQMMEHDLLY
jgi:hypothetical protein